MSITTLPSVEEYRSYIIELSLRGPEQKDYTTLHEFFHNVAQLRSESLLTHSDILEMRTWFNGAMSTTETMQGHVCVKPFGYHGDFMIIDRIYRQVICSEPVYAKWDQFFHQGDAPQAVRNRKTYFIDKLKNLGPGSSVLNLASGPCRDLAEYYSQSETAIDIDCVELDVKAIEYSRSILCNEEPVRFMQSNVFKFMPEQSYDLIWSAGLFDYLTDKEFRTLLRRFSGFVNPGGSLLVGNFNTDILSQDYMEFGGWNLNYRDKNHLLSLADDIQATEITVEAEPLNVNLFLNIKF